MKTKVTSFENFQERIAPFIAEYTAENDVTFCFEFCRRTGANTYEESTPELSTFDEDSTVFEFEDQSQGPYLYTSAVPNPPRVLKLDKELDVGDFYFNSFGSLDGYPSLESAKENYLRIVNEASSVMEEYQQLALICFGCLVGTGVNGVFPICTLVETAPCGGNKEIVKINI